MPGWIKPEIAVEKGISSTNPCPVGPPGPQGEQGPPGPGITTGTIVLWSGTPEDIPEGWYHCDGTNGTLDTPYIKVKGIDVPLIMKG